MHHRVPIETKEARWRDYSHPERYSRPHASMTVRAIGGMATEARGGEPKTPEASLEFGIEVAPSVDDYMHLPIEEGFDWPSIVGEATRTTGIEQFYLVVFRSQQNRVQIVHC